MTAVEYEWCENFTTRRRWVGATFRILQLKRFLGLKFWR